jgi:hypothetical protein
MEPYVSGLKVGGSVGIGICIEKCRPSSIKFMETSAV